ncbi:MAG: hypothetical protein NTY12_04885 [Candidatus Falkowbacteria bacterium]|nr:hypothetical protein [Candidatus Falkowbacteria bacterium]
MFLSKIGPRLAWLIFYLALALILSVNSFGYLDPDFGWHLRVGENIAQSLSVPHDQIYMWSLPNKNWVDHEWLSNLITYGLWQIGGYTAVSLFFILLPLLGFILLNKYLFTNYLKSKAHRSIFAALELLALIACLPHFGVRLQEIGFVFTILLFIIIDSCRRKQNIKLAYWLPPLIFLWACLHGSFLFGLATILGWLIYEIILKLIPGIKNYFNEQALSNKDLIKLAGIVLISLAATLCTPYRLELYSFLSEYGTNRYYLSHIEEWRTPYSIPFAYFQIIYAQIIVILVIATRTYTKKYLSLWKLVLSLGLLLMASRSVRHFPLWAAASLIFLAPNIIKLTLENTKIFYGKFISYLAIFCTLLIALVLGLQTDFTSKPFTNYCDRYPCGAVQFLKNSPHYGDLKIFNDYSWGGYLIGVWPEKKIFIDGRLPQYSFNKHTMLEEYSSFFQNNQTKEKFNEYVINLVLFKSTEAPSSVDWFEQLITGEKDNRERKNPLIEYLKNSADWKAVYSDKVATVYVRK